MGDGQREQRLQTIKCSHRINFDWHQFHVVPAPVRSFELVGRCFTICTIHILNTNIMYLKYPWATKPPPYHNLHSAHIISSIRIGRRWRTHIEVAGTGHTQNHGNCVRAFFFSFVRCSLGDTYVRTVATKYDKWHASHGTTKEKKTIVSSNFSFGCSLGQERNVRTKSRRDFDIFYKLMWHFQWFLWEIMCFIWSLELKYGARTQTRLTANQWNDTKKNCEQILVRPFWWPSGIASE